ncbi:mechanosensitive ion channel family protein [Entomospira culicis]|uniref:Mechanosensitive ion channel family protein n=1 Tax=Entomospira culicis TaxID=2719989 RepID=A0A968KWK6_9SPIO|nr:mechanosensitive ion channel family protein [Entomospira culicis]NIZ19123.1 mechanosensitive ion channel family protein [Entomospira culicis]NIZ69337.1 mechanosensitive ion channel family protein [Entomospira culicis]WDI37923.1 mechanosensitive ion channel family protein [Entomospira culicis]WDI39550.1 mechanosensitive ion channel family protein [Entomospira culicis]
MNDLKSTFAPWSHIFPNNNTPSSEQLLQSSPYFIGFFLGLMLLSLWVALTRRPLLALSKEKMNRYLKYLRYTFFFTYLLTAILLILIVFMNTKIVILGLMLLSVLLGFHLSILFDKIAKETPPQSAELLVIDYIYKGIGWPLRLLSISYALLLLMQHFALPATFLFYLGTTQKILIIFSWALFLHHMIKLLYAYMVSPLCKTPSTLDITAAQGISLSLRALLIVLVLASILPIFSKESLSAIIAGLGIGGAAIALASQDLLKNIFGGFTIMFDKPFKIGERVQIDQIDGVVETIGFRSTRVRLLNGQLTTVPNQVIANVAINNVTSRPNLRRDIILLLSLDTPPEKILRFIEALKKLFAEKYPTLTDPDSPPMIFFEDILSTGFSIKIVYRQLDLSYNVYVEQGQAINVDILALLKEMNIDLAVPVRKMLTEMAGE